MDKKADAGENEDDMVERFDERRLSLLRLIGRDVGIVRADLTLPERNDGHGSDSKTGEKAGVDALVSELTYEPDGEAGVGISSCGGEAVEPEVREARLASASCA